MTSHVLIGQRLVAAGRITPAQVQEALAQQKERGGRIGDALLALKFVTEPDLLMELARQHGVRYVFLGGRYVPREIVRLVPEKYARSRRVLPIALAPDQRRGKLFLATSAPQNLTVLDEVAFITGMTVQPLLASDRDVDELIEHVFKSGDSDAGASAGADSVSATAVTVEVS